MNNFSLKAMPFDSEVITNPKTGQEEYDRTAHAKDLADLVRAYFSNGILVQGSDLLTNELQVVNLSAMSCVVKPGGIIINGRTGFLENEQTIEFDVGTQNPRIDRVVAELNVAERNIYIRVLKGIPAADPKPVDIMQTEDIYQITLAQVRVNANHSVIASVTDERAGHISNVLLNQAPSKEIMANTVGISETLRTLYGLSTDNANVEKALQKIRSYTVETITTSQIWTPPVGVNVVDVYLCAGGGGGGAGGYLINRQDPGAGGGGGGCLFISHIKVEANVKINCCIGAGGTGAPIAANAGNGGDTTFGNLKVNGGGAGSTAYRGGGSGTSNGGGGENGYPGVRTSLWETCFAYNPFDNLFYGSGGANGNFAGGQPPYPQSNPGGSGSGPGGYWDHPDGYNALPNRGGGGGGGASRWQSPEVVGAGGNGSSGVIMIGYWR